MNKRFNIFLSILFLGLFLFPQIEKEIHIIEHASDFHCDSSDKHFHDQEHSCSICDYTIIDSFSFDSVKNEFVLFEKPIAFVVHLENLNIPSAFSDIPARAPPLL